MADITFDPTGAVAIVQAAAEIAKAVCESINANRATMSPAARDESDHIQFQAYWDWRNILEFFKIVGPKMEWPPTTTTTPGAK